MKRILLILFFVFEIALANTQPLFNFIKTTDWEFMGDKTKFSFDLCRCDFNDGTVSAAGMRARIAEPIGLIEFTNTPWNVVSIDKKFDEKLTRKQGNGRNNQINRRYGHFIAFAPLGFLNFVQDFVCFERFTSLSFLYWTEIIPTQTNDIFALFTQASKGPFSKVWMNNTIGALACVADCAATTFNDPMNSLHWCAGCSGSSGNNTAYGANRADDPLMQAHAHALAVIDDLHYAGVLSKVSNATFAYSPVSRVANSECEPRYFPMGIKSQYYLQLATPSVWSATTIGKGAPFWAFFKNTPSSEDDVAFWVWSIKDTCVGGAKCKSMFTQQTNSSN